MKLAQASLVGSWASVALQLKVGSGWFIGTFSPSWSLDFQPCCHRPLSASEPNRNSSCSHWQRPGPGPQCFQVVTAGQPCDHLLVTGAQKRVFLHPSIHTPKAPKPLSLQRQQSRCQMPLSRSQCQEQQKDLWRCAFSGTLRSRVCRG